MDIKEEPTALGISRKYTGDTCTLTVILEPNQTVLAYIMKHNDLLYAPDIFVTPITGKPKQVYVQIGFHNLMSLSLKNLDRLQKVIQDIQAFCKECEEMGLFQVCD